MTLKYFATSDGQLGLGIKDLLRILRLFVLYAVRKSKCLSAL
jgi:hypothetical protein